MTTPGETHTQPDPDKALELMVGIMFPHGKPAFAERLAQVRDSTGEVLDEDQYKQLRREILDELVSTSTFRRVYAVTLSTMFLGGTSMALIGWYSSDPGLAVGGVLMALLTVYFGYRTYRHAQSKNTLSRTARMQVVDELLSKDLITQDEANKLRSRIEQLPPTVKEV